MRSAAAKAEATSLRACGTTEAMPWYESGNRRENCRIKTHKLLKFPRPPGINELDRRKVKACKYSDLSWRYSTSVPSLVLRLPVREWPKPICVTTTV